MYKVYLFTLVLGLLSPLGVSASPLQGSEGVGGGDPCESRIQQVRDQLSKWIDDGGHAKLQLPSGITPSKYRREMKKWFRKASIVCENSNERPIFITDPISGAAIPKVCRFNKARGRGTVTCDRQGLLELPDGPWLYRTIHHEFASLAGFEQPEGAISNYDLSNQISNRVTSEVVARLAVNVKANGYCQNTVVDGPICAVVLPFSLEETARRLGASSARIKSLWFKDSEDQFIKLREAGRDALEIEINAWAFHRKTLVIPAEDRAELDPLKADRIGIRLVRQGPSTLVVLAKETGLGAETTVGGALPMINLAGCQIRGATPEQCASFKFSIGTDGALAVSVGLNQVLGAKEDVYTRFNFDFDGGSNLVIESKYLEGNGDDNYTKNYARTVFNLNGPKSEAAKWLRTDE